MELTASGTHLKGVCDEPVGGVAAYRYGLGGYGSEQQLRVSWRHGTSGVAQTLTVYAKKLASGDIESSVGYTTVGTIYKAAPQDQQVFVDVLDMPFDVGEGEILHIKITPSNTNWALLSLELVHGEQLAVDCS